MEVSNLIFCVDRNRKSNVLKSFLIYFWVFDLIPLFSENRWFSIFWNRVLIKLEYLCQNPQLYLRSESISIEFYFISCHPGFLEDNMNGENYHKIWIQASKNSSRNVPTSCPAAQIRNMEVTPSQGTFSQIFPLSSLSFDANIDQFIISFH